jgi:signal transduction histidine kinase
MLHEFMATNRAELIRRAQSSVAERYSPRPTEEELTKGLPLFFDQLTDALKRKTTSPCPPDSEQMESTAATHGNDLLRQGFTIAAVVHDYGALCQAVTELAGSTAVVITPEDFQTFNGCLDSAIAAAVTAYARQREESLSHLEVERLGFLAHEMRNLLSTLRLSFQMLQRGTVPIGGSTGGLIERTLISMSHLVDRSLAEVRLDAGIEMKERLRLAELFEDVEVAVAPDAARRNLVFTVRSVPYSLFIEGDRQLLTAAITNLLQNALKFKFTRPKGNITLTTGVVDGRVLIDVEDECGGLPAGAAERMFRPFEQHGYDRTGLGLGLAIVRRTVQATAGELRVRDLPGKGCIFTIDLPLMGAEKASSAEPSVDAVH